MDPYSAQMLIYRAEMYILMRYPYLIDLNINNSELSKTVDDKSFFFVIKSFSEEDVHKVNLNKYRQLNIMSGPVLSQETKH